MIAIVALAMGMGADSAPKKPQNAVSITSSVEFAEDGAWEKLERVPEAARDADWLYLRALSALASGRENDARLLTSRAETGGAPRAWMLAEFLRLESGEASQPPPDSWAENPSVIDGVLLMRWGRGAVGCSFAGCSQLHEVLHFGGWPARVAAGRDELEPRLPADRLAWLNARPGALLAKLSGAGSHRALFPNRKDGRWILLSFFRAHSSFSRYAAWDARLWELLGKPQRFVFLWIVELPASAEDLQWQRQIPNDMPPLFVSATRDSGNFAAPGFERGGIHLLLDPALRVQVVVPRGIPLPVLHGVIADHIATSQ